MYNQHPKRKLLADMDKTQLLKMREDQQMSNSEIALAVGCSEMTVYRAIGPMPLEMRAQKKREAGMRGAASKWSKTSEGGYTVERKTPSFMPQREEKPVEAVLVVKKAPIHLHGACFDYTLDESRKSIEVETEEGRVLLSMETEKLGAFIEELRAIRKNMSVAQTAPFWG